MDPQGWVPLRIPLRIRHSVAHSPFLEAMHPPAFPFCPTPPHGPRLHRARMHARRPLSASLTFLLLTLAVRPLPLTAASAPPPDVRDVLEHHCVKCHGGDSPKADLSLEPLLEGGGDLQLWQSALEKLETGAMPPKSKPRPAQDDKRRAADWLTALVLAEKS